MTTAKEAASINAQKALAWVIQIGTTILLAVVAFIVNDVKDSIDLLRVSDQSHAEAIAGINASRFTASDGMQVQKEMSRLWQELSKYPLRSEVPPPEVTIRFNDLERRVENLEEGQ